MVAGHPANFNYPGTTLVVIGLLDLLLPFIAFRFSSKLGKRGWLVHGFAIAVMILSPFILLGLITLEAQQDAVEGIVVMPLYLMLALELPLYVITLCVITLLRLNLRRSE